ncbi:MAG TPA: alpha/beta fold hydrolase [Rhizobacter sp.]|jgi:predicted alpha/beta hydrolase|nr:alpha/beta fold hydrolase [Rhizobacter sp.]
MQAFEFKAADGFALQGRLYGDPAACRSAVLIVAAMGVPQRFYADFAAWLVSQGHAVMSFDYRGTGESRPAHMKHSLRGLQADITTWAEQDTAAALAWLDAQVSAQTPIHWLGHSLGGQIFGMVPNRARVSGVVTIGVGTGYWLRNAAKARAYVWWLWFVVAPLAMKLKGYFPGKRLRKVGDLPLGVMQQWRRACLNRDYLVGVGGAKMRRDYAAVTTPILSLSFTDDEYMSARNTADMHAFYANAPREMRRIAPRDIGEKRIGHFGFFRQRFAPTLWPQVSQWLALHTST